jgi:hypothetical protein
MSLSTNQTGRSTNGSAITVAAVSAGVLSILVAGFLTYITNEQILNLRSHRWTHALHLAEGASEIGFAEFNYQYFLGGNGFQSARGWNSLGGGAYSKTVSNLTDTTGRVAGDYTVIVSGVGSSSPHILGVGTCDNPSYGGVSVTRAVKVVLASSSRFPVGLMSKNNINMNGNNFYSDSFDSTDSTKSTNGEYDSAKKQPNGDVASNSGLTNTVSIGNAEVYGSVWTGPEDTVSIGPNGSVGPTFDSSARADTVAEGIANGWIRSDFSADVPNVSLPSDFSPSSSLGNINTAITITSGDYTVTSIGLTGNGKVLTVSTGTVRLHVTGNVNVSGLGEIIILNGAHLEVYVAGSVSIAGNGVVNANTTPLAIDNQWFGLSSSTSWSIAGNGEWIGTIYAPQADLSVSGNGTLSGAVVANSLTLGGNAAFHYDESLESLGGSVGYVIASWQAGRMVNNNFVPE